MPHRIAWLRLAQAAPGNSATLAGLREIEPDLEQLGHRLARLLEGDDEAFGARQSNDEPPPLSPRLISRLRHPAGAEHAHDMIEWAASSSNRHLLIPTDPAYPAGLRTLSDAPAMLAVTGQLCALDRPGIAMVGSRQASRQGLAIANRFANELAGLGFSVISGLAIGVDGAAHRGALDTDGITLAVSATGPDRIYPARHRDLAEQITQRGAIVSEYPLGEGIHRWRFPQRNRLVAALSYGVVLIEAARRSGTLTTARHAIELGKPVMPVPGSIAHGRNSGSHDLIRDGAFLVEDTREIAALVAPAIGADLATSSVKSESSGQNHTVKTSAVLDSLDRDATRALACLDGDAMDVDTLCERCALPPARVIAALSRLELAGLAERAFNGGYARCLNQACS